MTDAEQWLILAVVALLAVLFTGFLSLAVVLVARTIGSIGRRLAAWRPAGGSQSDERASAGVIGAIPGERSVLGWD